MNKLLTVVSCTKTENDNFMNKLQAKTEVSVDSMFGTSVRKTQETYYLFTDQENEIGFEAELDLSNFNIKEKDYTIPDGEGAGTVVALKYLSPR